MSARREPRSQPLIKLTVSLHRTYSEINNKYYSNKQPLSFSTRHERPEADTWDDKNNDYIITKGEMLENRFRVKDVVGEGTYGKVIRAKDNSKNKDVAIKISKSTEVFKAAAKNEIDILKSICKEGKRFHIVELHSQFFYRNHYFIVFELLSVNLNEVLKSTQFAGVSFRSNRDYARQMLTALSFLRVSQIDTIHCDVKPENILLINSLRNDIKLIDFGSSCKSKQCTGTRGGYLQSRFYRSPEIMLGLPFSFPIDMWSLGCILVEMHTGRPIFTGVDTTDQMRSVVEVMGMVPSHMLNKSKFEHRALMFEEGKNTYDSEWKLKKSLRPVQPSPDPMISLLQIIGQHISRKMVMYPADEPGESSSCYDMFIDLIFHMLCFDPAKRITPNEALQHPYFHYIL